MFPEDRDEVRQLIAEAAGSLHQGLSDDDLSKVEAMIDAKVAAALAGQPKGLTMLDLNRAFAPVEASIKELDARLTARIDALGKPIDPPVDAKV